MIDILTQSAEVLAGAHFATSHTSIDDRAALLFEDATVVGFLLAFEDPRDLVKYWAEATDRVVKHHQVGLRRAGRKAWNAYLILLAKREGGHAELAALSAIEEDLAGTRKIARAGVLSVADVEAALLPLLRLQSAPRLEAVDMVAEIRERTTALPTRAVEAFLSSADEAVVLQILEEEPP